MRFSTNRRAPGIQGSLTEFYILSNRRENSLSDMKGELIRNRERY